MPTIIALDASLSMTRPISSVNIEENANYQTFSTLAISGIHTLLDYIEGTYSRLEFVSLMIYSQLYEVVVDFTRDYELIRAALTKIDHFDKTSINHMLRACNKIFSSTWGAQNYCQIIVVTDCGVGIGPNSLKNTLNNIKISRTGNGAIEPPILPLAVPSKISFVCLGNTADPSFKHGTNIYQQLLDISGQKGQLFIPNCVDHHNSLDRKKSDNGNESSASGSNDGNHLQNGGKKLSERIVKKLFKSMAEINFKPFEATLNCGSYFKLDTNVALWPQPLPHVCKDNFGNETVRSISRKIDVCGFISLSEIGSPYTLSRHLVLPRIEKDNHHHHKHRSSENKNMSELEKLDADMKLFFTKTLTDEKMVEDDETASTSSSVIHTQNDALKESVCVLLHGSLKVENIAALVVLADNWFGFCFSYTDKKKSNLMLTLLPPGSDSVPWLGDLRYLGTVEDAIGENPSFPVKPDKRSYSLNNVVWIRQSGLQSDIQKLLRHSKKMPEKTGNFYKELNKIRRCALSLGFLTLLEFLSYLFEREAQNFSPSSEISLQLRYAASELRKIDNRDLKTLITPLQTV